MRYVDELLVLRLTSQLSAVRLGHLNEHFSDILVSGKIEQRNALPEEASEPDLEALPRITLHFNRRNLGRLRQLIDAINATEE